LTAAFNGAVENAEAGIAAGLTPAVPAGYFVISPGSHRRRRRLIPTEDERALRKCRRAFALPTYGAVPPGINHGLPDPAEILIVGSFTQMCE
jgi:hypothetical protein